MDPALYELSEEGPQDDLVSVIIRLADGANIPSGVHVVSRFGEPAKIITARIRRGDIRQVHGSDAVASMKAPRQVRWEDGSDDAEQQEVLEHSNAFFEAVSDVKENGAGVLVALIDYGLDFTHPNFRNADGSTRIKAIWDQGASAGVSPQPFGYGAEYAREAINAALATKDPFKTLGYQPSDADPLGNGAHGTHVADIMAGNRATEGSRVGLATASDIIFVHLAAQRMGTLANFGDSVRLLEAVDFIRRRAGSTPCVINTSAGKTGGPHDESTLFTQALDALLVNHNGLLFAQSVGNYADSRMHTHARIGPTQRKTLHWLINAKDRTPNELEVWYSGDDEFSVAVTAPDGSRFEAALGDIVKMSEAGTRWGTLYHRRREPNSGMNHIDLFLRTDSPAGRYKVELTGRDVVDGRFHAWIERDAGGKHQSHFPKWQATRGYTTNTICNSLRGIAVGAYNPWKPQRPATRFSSRGPTLDGRQKPELSAPGYRIPAARSQPEEGWHGESPLTVKSGTSMAAPWVSGALALMVQAAGRPLSVTEARGLLIASVDSLHNKADAKKLGYGYLNVAAAVEAARSFGREKNNDIPLNGRGGFGPSAPKARRFITTEGQLQQPPQKPDASETRNQKELTMHVNEKSFYTNPGDAARLFDNSVRGDVATAHQYGMQVLAMPGESIPDNLPDDTVMLVRALGEGRYAVARNVSFVGKGRWSVEGVARPLRRHARLDEDQILLAPHAPELLTRCGFFGPNVRRREQAVRDAVRDAALAEWNHWHTAGAPRDESDVALFGHLVRYYISTGSDIRPDTLTAILTNASRVNYGVIPAAGANDAAINRWAATVAGLLLNGVPHANTPANLVTLVRNAAKHARQAHRDSGAYAAWSAAWVSACVRGAGMQLGLETMIQGNHWRKDALLLATGRHAEYTWEAHQRRFGPNQRDGTYHAFDPATRSPQVGDIIVQERRRAPQNPLDFSRIRAIAGGFLLHGDIVVEVGNNFVIAVGGNVGDSCRKRRYPLNAENHLVMQRQQLYTQEDNRGNLPAVPARTAQQMHARSTLRIFALLSPVEICAAVPGQPVGGGVLI